MTKLLADAGYTCGLAGKLHLSACHPDVAPVPRRIDDGYAEFYWSQSPGREPWDRHDYRDWLEQRGGYTERVPHPLSRYVQIGQPEQTHQTTWCCEMAIDFLTRHQKKPWAFSVNMFAPHHAFNPPRSRIARYEAMLDDIPLPDYLPGELADKSPFQQIDHTESYGGTCGFSFDEMTDTDHRMVRAAYWAMCDQIDTQVGRILDALEATGQADNTLIIFISDHGEMLGDHGIYLKGPYFYDHLLRVPLIVHWPKRIAPRRLDTLVELIDLAPTLLDAARLPRYPGMQGRSIWEMLTDPAVPDRHRDDVYCAYYDAMPFHQNPTANLTMLRTATHKLTIDHAHESGELYDLTTDAGEHRNLWHSPDYASIKSDLLLRLTHRMADTVDPLPQRRAPW